MCRCRAKSQAECDRYGLFGTVCDHVIFLKGVWMNSGENWRYATMLVLLMLLANIVPLFFFYDINCRFAAYFLRWLANRSDLSPQAKAAAAAIYMALPPFHVYMHNAACREENGLQNERFPAYGRPCGEATELYWSMMNRLARLKYGTLLYMSVFVEGLIADINGRKRAQLGTFIVTRIKDLKQRIAARQEALDRLRADSFEAPRNLVCAGCRFTMIRFPDSSALSAVVHVSQPGHHEHSLLCARTETQGALLLQDAALELQPMPITSEMRLVLVLAEQYHLEHGAANGCIPMELVCSTTGKPAISKRLSELQQLEGTLRLAVPAVSGALAAEGSPEFQLLVISVSIAQVLSFFLIMCVVHLVCSSSDEFE